MPAPSDHPISRFVAPSTITTGQPLKHLLDPVLVGLVGESFAAVSDAFDRERFEALACDGLDERTMKERAHHIGDALAAVLPDDVPAAVSVLIDALGPLVTATEGNGLRGFFYMPHTSFVERHALDHFEQGMAANHELTRRFTAEFSVRPFLERHQGRALKLLSRWTKDPDPHVRRLCSEGTRPRLPWASRLTALAADPQLALPLLEALKDDPELYVRRSVANHLGDVCKDHPEHVFALCHRWLDEVEGASAEAKKQRRWMIRHAVRLPAKKKVAEALDLRERAKA
jgi:3-methyladenine DNA glycosylase AlkC